MQIDPHYFTWYPDERGIANLPWVIAHKRRKAGLLSSLDTVADTTCGNRPSDKPESIDRNGRSSAEIEAWNKLLEHAGTQARVRAVQMHLRCITTL